MAMLAELLLDEGRVDDERLAAAVLGVEADVLEQFLHHRLQPPRADILDRFVDLGGDAGERLDAVVGEGDGHAFGAEQAPDIARSGWRGSPTGCARNPRCVSAFSSTRIGSRP